MTEPNAPTPPPKPQTVDFCLPCVKCWYDLRGIGVRDSCPECGTPVSRTTRSLFASGSEYLRALRRKLVGLEALWTVNFLLIAFFPLLVDAAPGRPRFGSARLAHLLLVAVPLMIRGAVLLSEVIKPEGRLTRVEFVPGRRGATLLNWATGYAAAFTIGAACFAIAHGVGDFEALVLWGACATALLLTLRNLALAPHLRRMGRRLRVRVRWGTPWLLPLLGVAFWGAGYGVSRFLGNDAPVVQALDTVTAIMIFVGLCAVLSEVAKFRRRIRDVIRFRESQGKVRPRHAR